MEKKEIETELKKFYEMVAPKIHGDKTAQNLFFSALNKLEKLASPVQPLQEEDSVNFWKNKYYECLLRYNPPPIDDDNIQSF